MHCCNRYVSISLCVVVTADVHPAPRRASAADLGRVEAEICALASSHHKLALSCHTAALSCHMGALPCHTGTAGQKRGRAPERGSRSASPSPKRARSKRDKQEMERLVKKTDRLVSNALDITREVRQQAGLPTSTRAITSSAEEARDAPRYKEG